MSRADHYPPARRQLLAHDHGGALTSSRGLVLHVQQGDHSPYGWFDRPDVDASSHWWVAKDGQVVEMVPAKVVAWAQAAGNSSWHSVETEGFPGEALTPAQLTALGHLYAWGRVEWGWALQQADSPSGFGLGTHSMGGTAWGGHACPGPIRAGQRADILRLAIRELGDVRNRFAGQPTIRIRDVGHLAAVKLLQAGLNNAIGAHLAVDGVFGPATDTSVRNLQQFWGLQPVDGIVGPDTWRQLDVALDLAGR